MGGVGPEAADGCRNSKEGLSLVPSCVVSYRVVSYRLGVSPRWHTPNGRSGTEMARRSVLDGAVSRRPAERPDPGLFHAAANGNVR